MQLLQYYGGKESVKTSGLSKKQMIPINKMAKANFEKNKTCGDDSQLQGMERDRR